MLFETLFILVGVFKSLQREVVGWRGVYTPLHPTTSLKDYPGQQNNGSNTRAVCRGNMDLSKILNNLTNRVEVYE